MNTDDSIKDLQLRVHDLERDYHYLRDGHDTHKRNYNSLKAELDKLLRVLNQIRWMITGGAIYFLASQVGIINILKGYLL